MEKKDYMKQEGFEKARMDMSFSIGREISRDEFADMLYRLSKIELNGEVNFYQIS